ncbi:MAG TPA: RNA polymerase sigma factor [Anaerolineae bacterium]|nr:RNA polymerase sigma factor [Anaerolineae bacterium]
MDLIRRSQAGDQEAWAGLFERYKNLVFKTAYLMLGSASEAEDALQEVFIRVYRSLSAFEPSKGSFATWLHRITVNHCLNQRRRRRFLVVALDEASPASLSGHYPSPEGRMGEKAAVQQALSRLSDKQRGVVILRYYWEMSYAEIARVLDIPLGTVKSRLNLALKTLHKELEALTENSSGPLSQRETAR